MREKTGIVPETTPLTEIALDTGILARHRVASRDSMRRPILPALLLSLPLAAGAAVYKGELVDPAYLEEIRKQELPGPPRSRTAAERLLPLPDASHVPFVPPTGSVRAQAEYETNDGLIIRWGTFQTALLTQMTVAVTTLTPDARMYVVVTGASQQSSATTTLTNAGANMSRVVFVTQACTGADTGCNIWMRDYGPRFVDNDGVRVGIDHVYNRTGRNGDDRFPITWAAATGEPRYDMPITHGGGNFHLFSTRAAFMTQLISNENPALTAQQIRDTYLLYQGLNVEIVPAFTTNFDATQHIDMWIFPVDDDEIIVSEYPASATLPDSITDSFAANRAGEGYTVYRTPGWFRNCSPNCTHYTYANSIVINNIVLVCRFNTSVTPSGTEAENTSAANTYAAAFEDKTIVPVDCSGIIGAAGAIHCIVMHVPRMNVVADFMFEDGFE